MFITVYPLSSQMKLIKTEQSGHLSFLRVVNPMDPASTVPRITPMTDSFVMRSCGYMDMELPQTYRHVGSSKLQFLTTNSSPGIITDTDVELIQYGNAAAPDAAIIANDDVPVASLCHSSRWREWKRHCRNALSFVDVLRPASERNGWGSAGALRAHSCGEYHANLMQHKLKLEKMQM
jgi:hypothetical protein